MVTHPCINWAYDCLTSVIKCKTFAPCYVSPHNIKYTYRSACGDIGYCIEFIWSTYNDTVVSCTDDIIGMCGISSIWGEYFVIGTCVFIAWNIKVAICFCFVLIWLVCGVIIYTASLDHMTRKFMLHLIWSSWPKKCNDIIDDAIGIT